MKILPEEKKKRLWSIFLLLVSVAGIIYFNFFGKRPAPPPSVDLSAPSPSQSLRETSKIKRPQAGLLPYGRDLDISLLETEEFKILKTTPKLLVNPEELGKVDIFAP